MKLTYRSIEKLTKIFMSAVILQLLFIVLGAESGQYMPCMVREMLEYCAASSVAALGGALLMEYILKSEKR